MNAVEILRKISHKVYENTSSYSSANGDLSPSQRNVLNHLGASIISLHGVAEFRVNPESPEVYFIFYFHDIYFMTICNLFFCLLHLVCIISLEKRS